MMTSPLKKEFADISERFYLLRFPLLAVVIMVHCLLPCWNPGPDAPVQFPLDLRLTLTDLRGILGVYFIGSGFFLTWKLGETEPFRYWSMMKKKLRTLILPFVLWNLIVFLPRILMPLVLKHSVLLPQTRYSGSAWETFVSVFGLDGSLPADVPLWFVRNLILFVILSPLIVFFFRKVRCFPAECLTVAFLLVYFGDGGFGYFTAGMWFGLRKIDFLAFENSPLTLPVLVLCAVLAFWFPCREEFPVFKNAHLIWMAGAYLCGSKYLTVSAFLRRWCGILGPAAFFLYCMHASVASPLKKIVERFPVSGFPAEFAEYLAVLLIVFGTCWAAYRLLERFFPKVLSVLCGGRT